MALLSSSLSSVVSTCGVFSSPSVSQRLLMNSCEEGSSLNHLFGASASKTVDRGNARIRPSLPGPLCCVRGSSGLRSIKRWMGNHRLDEGIIIHTGDMAAAALYVFAFGGGYAVLRATYGCRLRRPYGCAGSAGCIAVVTV